MRAWISSPTRLTEVSRAVSSSSSKTDPAGTVTSIISGSNRAGGAGGGSGGDSISCGSGARAAGSEGARGTLDSGTEGDDDAAGRLGAGGCAVMAGARSPQVPVRYCPGCKRSRLVRRRAEPNTPNERLPDDIVCLLIIVDSEFISGFIEPLVVFSPCSADNQINLSKCDLDQLRCTHGQSRHAACRSAVMLD